MDRASASEAVDSGLIPSRASPITLILAFIASLRDAQLERAVWRTSQQVYLCRWEGTYRHFIAIVAYMFIEHAFLYIILFKCSGIYLIDFSLKIWLLVPKILQIFFLKTLAIFFKFCFFNTCIF